MMPTDALQHLHPDLLNHVVKSDFGVMVTHPLVHMVLAPAPTREYIDFVNEGYEAIRDRAEATAAAGDHRGYIFTHEKPYRLEVLSNIAWAGLDKNPKEYWSLVAEVWRNSNNIWQNYETWREMWTASVPNREFAMSADDCAMLARLPENVEVWRGIACNGGLDGMSWTSSRDYGIWFAQRSAAIRGRPTLIRGMVKKVDILAAFDEAEQEIVALPDCVSIIETECCQDMPSMARPDLLAA